VHAADLERKALLGVPEIPRGTRAVRQFSGIGSSTAMSQILAFATKRRGREARHGRFHDSIVAAVRGAGGDGVSDDGDGVFYEADHGAEARIRQLDDGFAPNRWADAGFTLGNVDPRSLMHQQIGLIRALNV